MESMENKEKLKRDVVRKATIESATKYFDLLYDDPKIHEKNIVMKFTNKNGETIDRKASQYELSAIMEMVILSLNDKVGLKFGDFSIDKETIKSIEIIF
jgi:hypothetical protein